MSKSISNTQDLIDSRDVIERLEELTEEIQSALDEYNETEETNIKFDDFIDSDEYDTPDQDTIDEYKALKDLAEEGENYSDWKYGETLIKDSYFEEYAQDLAEDIGAINKDSVWPNNCINWTEAAEQLKQDYSSIYFAGEEYWIRS